MSEDLVPGWKWIGRKVDTADFEWKMWTPILSSWLQYVIPYLVISFALRKIHLKYRPLILTSISFVWLYNMLGMYMTLFLFIQPVLFHWIFHLFSLKLVWITSLVSTFSLHALNFNELIKVSCSFHFLFLTEQKYLFHFIL